jgi:hypothetical protein
MIRFLLFALLCMLTLAIIRFFRSLGRKATRERKSRVERRDRPPASPDEIVDVTYEDCESTGDKKEVGS